MDDDKTRLPNDSHRSESLSPGQAFGQYKVIRLLGRGGMGEVYEVEHGELGTRHALKLIKAEIVDRPDVKERFKREARVMARLHHPNIVHVDGLGELNGRIWLRMELINGWNYQGKTYHSLQDLMGDQGALPEPLVRRLLGEILDGLGFAHDAGAVHRDLKPANLLLDEEGRVKITDFGLVSLAGADWLQTQVQLTVARSMAHSTDSTSSLRTGSGQADPDATRLEMESASMGTSTNALLGTYAYMSPEQKKGGDVDARSDLYAIGLIVFQMLTDEETPGFEVPSDLVEDLNPAWDDWVKKAMISRMDRRFPSAEAMLLALPGLDALPGAKSIPVREAPRKDLAVSRSKSQPIEGNDYKFALSDDIGLKLKWIAPGTFMMGSPEEVREGGFLGFGERVIQEAESDRYDDELQHRVTLSQGYWLDEHEVTQGEWQSLMGSNPSRFKGMSLPVEMVSWENAMSFCRKLTERERSAGRLPGGLSYTLPTEAQWEYACRAGTTGAYAGDLDAMGWYSGNAGGKTHPVGQKRANAWGLYDMHGNVWEWCLDWYGDYPSESVVDPRGASSGARRVFRGGCWSCPGWGCRSAFRYGVSLSTTPHYSRLGFRLALTPSLRN